MNRRDAVRRMTLSSFAMAMGKFDVLAQGGGHLTCDLNQYTGLVVKFGHETITITAAEMFSALKEMK